MADKHFIVATAGHVDHGKSALVRALTGTDPDRLPEEKTRGITIDLGFAQLVLPGPPPDTFRLGIVDVPGHEDFVKNMVAGVGSVDLALLIVAADDGWMPQTEEHLQILSYLGVRLAVVALTKIDRAASPKAAEALVREKLRSSPYENAPIIPTSIVTGQGLDTLQCTIARMLTDARPPRDVGKPRLPVDRVFTLRGIGTVVTGTLIGGALQRGGSIIAQPSGRTGNVRTLQNHGREVENGLPGMRTALNLPDFDATGTSAIGRGEVVTLLKLGGPTHTLDVLLVRSERTVPDFTHHSLRSPALQPIRDGTRVRMYHGTGAWTVRVRLLDRGVLLPTRRAIARLSFDTPIFAFAGDRLILRDGTGRATLAGGRVLDPEPGRRPLRRASQRRFLERLAAVITDLPEVVAAWLERDRAIPAAALLQKSGFGAAEISAAVAQMTHDGKAVVAGEFVADPNWWKALLQRASDSIDAWHHEHPEQIGLPISQLRRRLERYLPAAVSFEVLLTSLTAKGDLVRADTVVRRASHLPALPPNLRAAGDRLRAVLAAKPFEPPSRKELAPDAVSRQALRFLCDTGEVLELGSDLVLFQDSYRRMKIIIARTLRATGSGTTSELRQVLGTTRRVIIPLLESLDRDGITRREGDRRFLK